MPNIKIIYRQTQIDCTVAEASTIEHAIMQSGILTQYPELKLAEQAVGIYNKVYPLEHVVRAGDRIEIYEPLKIDPKDARRHRAKVNK